MNTDDLLKEAIRLRKSIEFEYNRGDKIRGKRTGNPHILFIHPATNQIEVHIFQTGGVSDSDLNDGLPWRLFIVEFIENVEILYDQPSFNIAEGYNPSSPMYSNVIARV